MHVYLRNFCISIAIVRFQQRTEIELNSLVREVCVQHLLDLQCSTSEVTLLTTIEKPIISTGTGNIK
jgi:hypothetical protein